MENPNPKIHAVAPRTSVVLNDFETGLNVDYVFEQIRDICDPEYPNTLEELAVVHKNQIIVEEAPKYYVRVDFTPTIPHCSMATLIGLCIRVKLYRSLPSIYDVDIFIREGTHVAEFAINKQLNDKERVAAAMENLHLLAVVEQCLSGVPRPGIALNAD